MSRNTWLRPEKGNIASVRLLIWLAQRLGYRLTALLCWPATLYYAIMYPTVRHASWRYLTHLQKAGKLPRKHWGMVLTHINAYSRNILDRIFLLIDRFPQENLHFSGQNLIYDALKQGKGCILMGAHIGSFDVLRQFGLRAPTRFRMLMYRRFLGTASRFIESLVPDFDANIIELGKPDSMIAALKALKNGEIVGILADRAHDSNRFCPIPFLGQNAPLPAGPFQLAALTDAPVILVSAIRQKNGIYQITCQSLTMLRAENNAEISMSESLLPFMQAYARWMETLCEKYPYSWFNFFDFWEEGL